MNKQELQDRISLIESTLEKTWADEFYSSLSISITGILILISGLALSVIQVSYWFQVIVLLTTGFIAVGINAVLTYFHEKDKQNFLSRSRINLIFQAFIHLCCLVTFAVIFQEKSYSFVAAVMLFYGLLINANRLLIVKELRILGTLSLLMGIVSFFYSPLTPYAAFLILGFGHIFVGLLIRRSNGK